jgi:polysaccharide pyruvyl transferase WcaK-like protein
LSTTTPAPGSDHQVTGPRVGLFGRLGSGNIGNDATLEAALGYLRIEHPEAVLDCLCSGPERVRERYGIPAAQLQWFHADVRSRSRMARLGLTALRIGLGVLVDARRTAAWVSRHDVVIVPGMGILESTLPHRPWQFPYSLFLLSAFGRVFGTKVALVSVGANVVPRGPTRWLLASAGRLASYRSFRDDYSREAARTMGIAGARDRVYPDLVFALPAPPTPLSRGQSSRSVGVGVMAWYGANEDRDHAEELLTGYVETMTGFVQWLVETGHRVRLLIGDGCDDPVARTILDRIQIHWRGPGTAPVTYEPVSTVTELEAELADLDTVVATRFHNVLLALKCGRPTVAIGYGRKHDELMAQMGVGDFTEDIRDLDLERLKEHFTSLEDSNERITRTLAQHNAWNQARLECQFTELTAVLFATATPPARSSAR